MFQNVREDVEASLTNTFPRRSRQHIAHTMIYMFLAVLLVISGACTLDILAAMWAKSLAYYINEYLSTVAEVELIYGV